MSTVWELIKQDAPLETIQQACYDGMRMCQYSYEDAVGGVPPVEVTLAVAAASMGRIDILEWLPETKKYGGSIINAAVYHLDTLNWLKRQGYLSDSWDITRWEAIHKGNVNFLQWMDDEGIDLAPYASFCKEEHAEEHYCEAHYHKWRTCKEALLRNQPQVIEWALKNGYTWGNCTCDAVLERMFRPWKKGDEEAIKAIDECWDWKRTLETARKYGCPWDKEKCVKAASDFGHRTMRDWLMSLD